MGVFFPEDAGNGRERLLKNGLMPGEFSFIITTIFIWRTQ